MKSLLLSQEVTSGSEALAGTACSTPMARSLHGNLSISWTDSMAHLVMEGRDEPQLHLKVGASFLSGNELQQVLMLHARRAEDLPFTLPRLLVLGHGGSSVFCCSHTAPWPHSKAGTPSSIPLPLASQLQHP